MSSLQVQGFEGAAPKVQIFWGAQPAKVQRIQWAQLSGIQPGLRSCNISGKSKFIIWELCIKDNKRNGHMIQFGTEGLYVSKS